LRFFFPLLAVFSRIPPSSGNNDEGIYFVFDSGFGAK